MAAYKSKHGRRAWQRNPYSDANIYRVRKRVFPRESKWPWVISASIFVIVMVVGSYGLSFALSVHSVLDKSSVAIDSGKVFLDAAKNGDQDLLIQSATGVSAAAHEIKEELETPVWEFSARLPIIGSDVESVRTLVDVFIDFSDNALVPMAQSGNILALKDFAKDDSINFDALPSLLVAVDEAMPALNRSARTLESLPPAVIPQLSGIMGELTDTIVTVDSFLTRIRPLFPYLPEMFGTDGQTRNYLVLAQNTAEIHALGGFVGSIGVLSVNNGKIEMGDFEDIADIVQGQNGLGDPAGATEEEKVVFGVRCDSHHGDHNIIPDYSRVGQLYFNTWLHSKESEVDGVLGLDPVFLQYLLDAFGPIETSYGVTVDGSNCAAVMLNQSLFWWSPTECDVFYREVAEEALKRLLGNLDDIDLAKFLKAITKAGDENRCLMWVRDEEIESAVEKAGFAGQMKHDTTKPELGIYISDSSTSKMSFYLSSDVVISDARVRDSGATEYDVTVTIKNNFDLNARGEDNFPSYIKVRARGRSYCDLFEEVRIIAPEGGKIQGLYSERMNTREGEPGDYEWTDYHYQGLQVKATTFRIDQQESVVIHFTVVTSPEALEPIVIRKTPLMPPEIAYWNEDLSASHPEWNIETTV